MKSPDKNLHRIADRLTDEILKMAIIGYQVAQQSYQDRIEEIQMMLGERKKSPSTAPAKKKHRISAEGRKRIAEAQRKRWAAARKETAA